MKSKSALVYLINLSFFLYFLILLVERILSVAFSLADGINLFADGFHAYTYSLVFLSIGAFLVYLVLKCRENVKALFKPNEAVGFRHLCIAAGILLLSGMVHTEHTIGVIQFVSYGILILGILLQVILNVRQGGDKALHWLSFAYLVAFSMAIPVMYRSFLELHVLFHILEGFASFALVAVFTILLLRVFNGADDLFYLVPIIGAVVLDVALIAMRWNEEANFFVLIFIVLSSLLFIAGFVYKRIHKKKAEQA